MNTADYRPRQEGAILVVSMITLLVCTTMGIGLWYVADQDIKMVDIQVNRSETLYSAETCIDDAARWIEEEAVNGPPCKAVGTGTVCKSIPDVGDPKRTMSTDWRQSDNETIKYQKRMGKHDFSCTIELMSSISQEDSDGTGFSVKQGASYQGAISSTKYLYRIRSVGQGPDNVRSEVEVIASIISSL